MLREGFNTIGKESASTANKEPEYEEISVVAPPLLIRSR